MPPTESIVATSSMLICHYWSPYLSKRETVLEAQLTGLGLWKIKIGTLEDQVQEDFNYPNHDPDRNRLFYLTFFRDPLNVVIQRHNFFLKVIISQVQMKVYSIFNDISVSLMRVGPSAIAILLKNVKLMVVYRFQTDCRVAPTGRP